MASYAADLCPTLSERTRAGLGSGLVDTLKGFVTELRLERFVEQPG